jgi:hypothetical protein
MASRQISREAACQNAQHRASFENRIEEKSKGGCLKQSSLPPWDCSDSVIFKPLSLAAEIARLVRPFGFVIKNHYP